MVEYTIDNLLLYARCPTLLFFRTQLGIDSTSILKGQINAALRTACHTYLRNFETDPHGRGAGAKFTRDIASIIPPAEVRGGGRARTNFEKSIRGAYSTFDIFRRTMKFVEPSTIGAPYSYSLIINQTKYDGVIDAIITTGETHHVITLDFSAREPSEDVLDYSIRVTLAGHAFREIYGTEDNYKLVHYWVPGNMYMYVDREDGEYNAIRRELRVLATLYCECYEEGLWYRRRGYWCDSCYAREACKEIRF